MDAAEVAGMYGLQQDLGELGQSVGAFLNRLAPVEGVVGGAGGGGGGDGSSVFSSEDYDVGEGG